jgi:hypothetical protein
VTEYCSIVVKVLSLVLFRSKVPHYSTKVLCHYGPQPATLHPTHSTAAHTLNPDLQAPSSRPCIPALLHEFPTVEDVLVGVHKPHVAVTGVLVSLGVEIFRRRDDFMPNPRP